MTVDNNHNNSTHQETSMEEKVRKSNPQLLIMRKHLQVQSRCIGLLLSKLAKAIIGTKKFVCVYMYICKICEFL